jgi:hypothetical protein
MGSFLHNCSRVRACIVLPNTIQPLVKFCSTVTKLEQITNKCTGYFTSDNEPGGIENATHNTLPKLTRLF